MVAKKKSGKSKAKSTTPHATESKPEVAATEEKPKRTRTNNGPRKLVPIYATMAGHMVDRFSKLSDVLVTWPENIQDAVKTIASAFGEFAAALGEMDPDFIAPRRTRGAKAPLSAGDVVKISARALENYEGTFAATDLFTVARISPNGKMLKLQTDEGDHVMLPRIHVVRGDEIDQPVGEDEEDAVDEDGLEETGT